MINHYKPIECSDPNLKYNYNILGTNIVVCIDTYILIIKLNSLFALANL